MDSSDDYAVLHPDEAMEPTLQSIIDQKSLKWVFVGGKGGVGKTTTACSLATQLSYNRESVLLISTDPAHNLSDAFSQKFSKDATLVNGYPNLYAMEIDPTGSMQEMIESSEGGAMGGMLQDLAFAIPGVDEAMGFAEIMKHVKSMQFSVILFDTAPTGHTLRFISFPSVLEKALTKLSSLSGRLGPMMSSMSSMMGMPANTDEMFGKLESMKEVISEVQAQFTDPEKTTFVCVCIAEFLSIYETERLIQELTSYDIDTHAIVINQLLLNRSKDRNCAHCEARWKMQKKYLIEANELYASEFNLVRMPMLTEEVRGADKIKEFSKMLITPYEVPQ